MLTRFSVGLAVLGVLVVVVMGSSNDHSKKLKDIKPGDILIFDPGDGKEEVLVFERRNQDTFIFWGPRGSKVGYLLTRSFERKTNGNIFSPQSDQYAGLSVEYVLRLVKPP